MLNPLYDETIVNIDFGAIGKQVLWFMTGTHFILLRGWNSPNSLQEEFTDALNASDCVVWRGRK